ncbi:MAG: NUDIX domain-containing protein [Armatimonadota bacterium]|nr:MAG: NUDIX domain-containing protein [Armatimonadota bacterium]
MPTLRHKVLAYITHGNRLLVFSHPDAPDAGIQVPGGTIGDGEDPARAVLREAVEETGIHDLRVEAFLGRFDQDVPERGEIFRRNVFHLVCEGNPPETWQHEERHPSDGTPGPIMFEFFWVMLPDEVPPLAPGHDALLAELLARVRAAD